MLPSITRFCGNNTTEITINGITLYFSYETLIGFRKGIFLCIRKNEWGNATGKHINAIPGSGSVSRKDKEQFMCAYQEVMK